MSLLAHVEELSEKHRALHRQIELEMSHPLVDSLKVAELKRRKLRLKDQIRKAQGGTPLPATRHADRYREERAVLAGRNAPRQAANSDE